MEPADSGGSPRLTPLGLRVFTLVGLTLTGVGLGVAADFLAGSNISTSAGDILLGLMFSPLAVTLGGGFVTLAGASRAFFLGGLLFWPLYCLLAWRWLRAGSPWMRWVILLWCFQGFFQLLHRMQIVDVVMSV